MKPDQEDQNRKLLQNIDEKITELAKNIERTQIADYMELLNSPRKLIKRNIIAGISRGVGIAIGFTFFSGTILYLLQLLGALNLPIIGDYIAEIVRYVQFQLEGHRF